MGWTWFRRSPSLGLHMVWPLLLLYRDSLRLPESSSFDHSLLWLSVAIERGFLYALRHPLYSILQAGCLDVAAFVGIEQWGLRPLLRQLRYRAELALARLREYAQVPA